MVRCLFQHEYYVLLFELGDLGMVCSSPWCVTVIDVVVVQTKFASFLKNHGKHCLTFDISHSEDCYGGPFGDPFVWQL